MLRLPELLQSKVGELEEPLAHQRPDGVKGEWELVEPAERTIDQKIAASTGGWVTIPNLITLTGGATSAVGIHTTAEGLRERNMKRVAVGVGLLLAGRFCDVVDGSIAARRKVRGTAGALLDATSDKLLAAYADSEFTRIGIISHNVSAAHVSEQVTITAENAITKWLGGEPNARRSSKYGMFGLWGGMALRPIEAAAVMTERTRLARAAGMAARTSELSSIALNAVAVIQNARDIGGLVTQHHRA